MDSEVIASAEAQIVGRTSVTTSIQIPFPPGKNEMTVRIVATDTIEVAGQPAILKLKRPEHVDELAGRLFVLTVGVSQYKFPEYNLTYAATDAKTLATALKNQEGLAFGEVHTQVYTDDKATIENVRIGLEWLQRVATEHDVAVVFFSGHGLKGRRGLYYVTHEGDTEAIQYTCLNWEDIAMSLQKTNAKQTLFLSDACHAGAFAETQLATQADLARQLLEIDRVLVFASSKGEEFSLERPDWGHGAFTKALLEALGGQGDTNTDSSISIMELIEYTKDRVTSLTGHQQHPYLPKTSGFDGKLTISRLPSKSREPGLTSGSD
ncbi:MAG: caspase family protein [Planctomycetaceae bacterium]